MEEYIEYSALAGGAQKNRALYTLCWILIVILAVAAVLLGTNVLGKNANELSVNWLNVIGMVVCIAAAFVLYRRKDGLRMEYDYLIYENTLEVSGVMNRCRRRQIAQINLDRVQKAGITAVQSVPGASEKPHAWYVNSGIELVYLIYMEGNIRQAALLEMNENFISALRKRLPMGAWQNGEGKTH